MMLRRLALFISVLNMVGAGPVRDAADYRIAPDGTARTDRATLQAALDDARPVQPPGIVVNVPAGVWGLDGPVYLPVGAHLIGQGRDATTIQGATGYYGPLVVAGIDRRPGGRALAPEHLPDVFGRLDASAANGAGKRWGIRTFEDSHVGSFGGPIGQGPRPTTLAIEGQTSSLVPAFWADVTAFTLEWAVDQDPATGAPWHAGPQFGMYDKGRPGPWAVWTSGNAAAGEFQLLLQVVQGGTERTLRFAFPSPMGPAVHRMTAQVDVATRKVTAYVDGLQVPVQAFGWGADPTPITLAANRYAPFMLGASGYSSKVHGSDFVGGDGKFDRCYLGLHVLRGTRYADDGAGTAQRRRDGAAITDAGRYFAYVGQTIGCLTGERRPEQVTADRMVAVFYAQSVNSPAFFLSKEHASPFANLNNCAVSGLSILGAKGSPFGVALYVGCTTNFRVRDCAIQGGGFGIAGDWGIQYVTRVRDCTISGTDSAVYQLVALTEVEGCDFPLLGRNTLVNRLGGLKLRNCFFGNAGKPECVVYSDGGATTAEAIDVDIEDTQIPTVAGLVAIAHSDANRMGGWLRLKDVNWGGSNPNVPLVKLTQVPVGSTGPAYVSLDGLKDDYEHSALVRVEGPAWRGQVRHDMPFKQTPNVVYAGGTAGAVVVIPGTPEAAVPVPP